MLSTQNINDNAKSFYIYIAYWGALASYNKVQMNSKSFLSNILIIELKLLHDLVDFDMPC